MEILEDKPGKKILLLGNEAITRGALEAGVDVATTYPGTPSSEIADTFSFIAKEATSKKKDPGFYFEYSTNEKVALEVAAAASICGLRSLTCMKHVGLNVASDAFMTYLYIGCKGGHIIVSADDPGCHSSQNEQDNRYFAVFAGSPMLEPSTPQEAKEMTRLGFDISEELGSPILLRTTTRLNHVRGPVEIGKLKEPRRKGFFEKNPMLITTPDVARVRHAELLKMLKKAQELSEKSSFNYEVSIGKPVSWGIVTSGVSFNYVKEIVEDLKLNVRILKLGMTYPLPRKMCENFIKSCKNIVVVEELEPFLEDQLKIIAFDIGSNVKIFGKSTGHFSRLYEYNPDIVVDAFSKIFNVKNPFNKPVESKIKLPSRPPVLCPGCPHRATYFAAKKAKPKDVIYPTDIGCYTLGRYKPLEMADLLLCMGSNAGTACGLAVATNQKIISFMGDSTFFHAAIPAVIDAAHHNHDVVITILDNRTTAMTGHQPHPGTDFDGMGRKAKRILVEDVVKGCGIEHVEVVDPNKIKETTEAFKRALEFKGPAVIVSKSPCILLENSNKIKRGEEIFIYEIDQQKCKKCKICIAQFGCPAFYYGKDGNIFIDAQQCNGCGNCASICPFDAIHKKEAEK
ncbi:MAG: indolepyruvate ferredoxin oxidoreductase subunit alpha [Candidatus Thermoplasmatota archaeon]|jgi:indolepyruvate ferredoxin oxidoreductase alpha subunit|nr:indolepyruvate ferredoxin oxidoreductase subunit alpha [Candidatus Thermoplasmatota archaeon]